MRNESLSLPPVSQASQSRSFPFAEEDARIARQSWMAAHMTPKAAILAGKILNLLMLLLLIASLIWGALGWFRVGQAKVLVVRVNDVGRSEVVNLDNAYVPSEPELRYQLEEFVTRYYERNGFDLPRAAELIPEYLAPGPLKAWKAEIQAALPEISAGQKLRRVRILACRIDHPVLAATTGANATVRIALDPMSANGAIAGADPEGWEITFPFKTGMYPNLTDAIQRDQWIVRNPLGIQVLDIQQTRYIGADVNDPNSARIIDLAKDRAENSVRLDDYKTGRDLNGVASPTASPSSSRSTPPQ